MKAASRTSLLVVVPLLFASVWLANTWSPSHYSIVLRAFGALDDGLVLGKPRGILSDEWGVITPLIQATVNNGLARRNATSPYNEDLRTTLSMPILDWGIAFKPDKWLYPLVNGAYAYSFQWLFYLFAFVGGYALLFRRLGSAPVESFVLSLALFFTAFVQIWWTVFAPTVSVFPWILLALDIDNRIARATAIAWIGASWMLGFFYPPQFLPLGLAGLAVFMGVHFDRRRPASALVSAIGAAIGCSIAIFYLRDCLAGTIATVYPGQRRVDGGNLPAVMFAEVLWPAAFVKVDGFAGEFAVANTNYNLAEASVVGTCYTLLVLTFLDYRRAFSERLQAGDRRLIMALAIAFGALVAWQALPIPAGAVAWIGFDRVPPQRSLFASGLVLLLLLAQLARVYGLHFGWRRYLVFAILVLFGWGMAKAKGNLSLAQTFPDLVILPLAAWALLPSRWIDRHGRILVAGSAALWGAIAFGPFNPLQSAWPIFNRETTPLVRILEDRARHNPDHLLVADHYGATLNGWGFRSAAHVLPVPPMAHWRALLPEMDPAELNWIFNRFEHILPIEEDKPRIQVGSLNQILVPWAKLEDPLIGAVDVRPLADGLPSAPAGGHIDARVVVDGRLHVFGWAPWTGLADDQRLTVYGDSRLRPVRFSRIPRPDVAKALSNPALAYSGFELVFAPPAGGAGDLGAPICMVAAGTSNGVPALIVEDTGPCQPGARPVAVAH